MGTATYLDLSIVDFLPMSHMILFAKNTACGTAGQRRGGSGGRIARWIGRMDCRVDSSHCIGRVDGSHCIGQVDGSHSLVGWIALTVLVGWIALTVLVGWMALTVLVRWMALTVWSGG